MNLDWNLVYLGLKIMIHTSRALVSQSPLWRLVLRFSDNDLVHLQPGLSACPGIINWLRSVYEGMPPQLSRPVLLMPDWYSLGSRFLIYPRHINQQPRAVCKHSWLPKLQYSKRIPLPDSYLVNGECFLSSVINYLNDLKC